MSPLSPVGRSRHPYYMLRLSCDFQGTDFSSVSGLVLCLCAAARRWVPILSAAPCLAQGKPCMLCLQETFCNVTFPQFSYIPCIIPLGCPASLWAESPGDPCHHLLACSDLALFVRGGPSAVSFYHELCHLSGPCEWGGHLAETALYCPICCVWLLLIYFSSSFIQMREPFFLWWNGASLAVFLSSCHLFQVVRWCALPITVLMPLQK